MGTIEPVAAHGTRLRPVRVIGTEVVAYVRGRFPTKSIRSPSRSYSGIQTKHLALVRIACATFR